MGHYKDRKTEEMGELMLITHEGKEIDLEKLPVPQTRGTKQLTDKQRKLALLVATQPFHKMTMIEMCDLVGFTRQAGYNAMRKKEFDEYVEEILDARNRQFMGTVFSKLQGIIENSRSEKMVLEGIKIYLQMTGKLKEQTEVTHTIQEPKKLEELEREVIEMERELIGEIVEPNDE